FTRDRLAWDTPGVVDLCGCRAEHVDVLADDETLENAVPRVDAQLLGLHLFVGEVAASAPFWIDPLVHDRSLLYLDHLHVLREVEAAGVLGKPGIIEPGSRKVVIACGRLFAGKRLRAGGFDRDEPQAACRPCRGNDLRAEARRR